MFTCKHAYIDGLLRCFTLARTVQLASTGNSTQRAELSSSAVAYPALDWYTKSPIMSAENDSLESLKALKKVFDVRGCKAAPGCPSRLCCLSLQLHAGLMPIVRWRHTEQSEQCRHVSSSMHAHACSACIGTQRCHTPAALTHSHASCTLQEADEDGSGELDIDEFCTKLGPHLGVNLKRQQVAQLFLKIDADAGGTVDWWVLLQQQGLSRVGLSAVGTARIEVTLQESCRHCARSSGGFFG